jgi:hypothetical protein
MREELKQKLYSVAVNRATEENFEFSVVLRGNLIQFINNGVDRMTDRQYESIEHTRTAKNNLDVFVAKMIETCKTRNVQSRIDFTSFSITKSEVNTLWPYID